MNEQRFHGVADARPLDLGVRADPDGHVQIGAGIDKDVADALVVLDHGDPGLADHGADEILAPPGDDEVDVLLELQQHVDGLAVHHGDELHGVFGKPPGPEHAAQDAAQRHVGMDGLGTAPEDDGVAGLQAQGSRVGGHVGSRLVDDPDDPQRDPHAAHEQAVGAAPHGRDLAHGVGQRGDLLEPPGHGPDGLLVEGEPVDHGLRETLFAGNLDVLLVLLDEHVHVMDELLGHLDQRFVLLHARQVGHGRCSLPGVLRDLEDLLFDIHGHLAEEVRV